MRQTPRGNRARRVRRGLRTAAALCAALAGARALPAQPAPPPQAFTEMYVHYFANINQPGELRCDASGTTGPVWNGCGGRNSQATGRASSLAGRLGVQGEVRGVAGDIVYIPPATDPLEALRVEAYAVWNDVLRWSALPGTPAPASVLFDFAVEGTGRVDHMPPNQSSGHRCSPDTWGPNCSEPTSTQRALVEAQFLADWLDVGPLRPVDLTLESWDETHVLTASPDLIRTYEVPLRSSEIQFYMSLRLLAMSTYRGVVAGSAEADLSHTAGLTGIRFLDDQGNDVTGQVVYSFEHGTQVGPLAAPTPVPEPASVTLLGAGLLALAGLGYRRAGHAV